MVLLYCLFTDVAVEREVEGDVCEGDMGYGMPFRPGTFDGVIRYSHFLDVNKLVVMQ